MTHLTTHILRWAKFTSYIISCEEGTISIEIYKRAQGYFKIQAYIYNLWVKDEHRKKGIASMLLAKAEDIAREKGFKEAHLKWGGADSKDWVLDWYLRLGYKEYSVTMDATYLRKQLNLNPLT